MATADPIPAIDLTPYSCECCGTDCFCVTCTGTRCPEKLCVLFEGSGYSTDPADKVVQRFSIESPYGTYFQPGWSKPFVTGQRVNAAVTCFPGYLQVYVSFTYINPANSLQRWTAEYVLDVPIDECEELLTPLDLTVPIDTTLEDSHPTSSPPATVRVILSDPNVLGHPGEETARNNCCHNTESDYLCSREAPTDLPTSVTVTVGSTVLLGPDPWGTAPLTANLYTFASPTGFCWTASYRSDPVVWAGCSDETGSIELISYVSVTVNGGFFPHRYSPSFAYPPPGTGLLEVVANLAYRPVGDTGWGTVISSTSGIGTPPSQGASGLFRVPCEDFSATVIPPLFSTVFPGASWWVLPYDPPFHHFTPPECTGGGGMSGYVTSLTVAE